MPESENTAVGDDAPHLPSRRRNVRFYSQRAVNCRWLHHPNSFQQLPGRVTIRRFAADFTESGRNQFVIPMALENKDAASTLRSPLVIAS